MARSRRDWQYDRLRAELAVDRQRRLAQAGAVAVAPATGETGGGQAGTGGSGGGVVTPPVQPPPPTNQAPAQINIAWRAGFQNGVIPGATSTGTVLADLVAFPGTAIQFSESSDPDNKIRIEGSTVVLDSVPTGAHSFTVRASNDTGATTQSFLITRAAETPQPGNLAGTRDGSGNYTNIPFLMPTAANTGPRISNFKPATQIPAGTSGSVFRSGVLIVIRLKGYTLQGFDLRGYQIIVEADDVTIEDNWFDITSNQAKTILGDTAVGTAINFNRFTGSKTNNSFHEEFICLFMRGHHRSLVRNQFFNIPCDGCLYGGSVALISQNYVEGAGYIPGAHTDWITLNAGYPNQKRTIVSYNNVDLNGPLNDILTSSGTICIKDNPDNRSNYLIYRNRIRGGSIQHQISVDLLTRAEFAENYRYVLAGPPGYAAIGTGTNVASDGPYGAFYGEAYAQTNDLMIHDDIEAATGLASHELDGTLIQKIVNGRPLQPAISSVTTDGKVTFAAPGNGGSAITRYEYIVSIAGSGDFTAEANLPVTGTTTLSGFIAPIANAWNHVMVRAWNANGPGPWSKTFEFASAALTPTPPTFPSAPTLTGTAQDGQTLTIAANPVGYPSPDVVFQKQRDTAGNGTFVDVGSTFTTPSLGLVTADVGNKVRVKAVATNSEGAATAFTDPTALVAASSATIAYTSKGTFATSALGVGNPSITLTVTPGLPSGSGGLVLAGVQYAEPGDVVIPAGWTLVDSYTFFGNCGLAVIKADSDPVSAPTFTAPDGRGGDYLTAQLFRFSGGSGTIEAHSAEYYSNSASLSAGGAGRLALLFVGHEGNSIPATSITGSPTSGWTEQSEVAQTDASSYRQCFSLDTKDALTTGVGSVAKPTRTYTPSNPPVGAYVFMLIY